MEFCMGSVADILEVFKAPLQEAEIAAVLAKVVEGLIFLHSKKRIHRDIKAANILMTSRGKVKIADFGSGSMSDPANTFVGTPCWMAPEVILAMESGLYSCKADIWSLGITAIELAERKPPLIEMNTMSALYHIPEKPPPTLKKPAAWSNEFSDFIESCLRKDPEQRLTAAELLQHPFLQNDKANHNRTLKLLVRRSKNAASLEPGEPIVFEAPVAVAAPAAAVAAPTPLASTVSLDEDGTEDTEELRKRRRNQSKPAKKDKAADGDAAAPAATPTASPARSAMPSHLAAPLKRDSFANLAPSDANHTPRRGAHERMASVVSVESNIVSDFHLNDSANDAWEAENHDQTIRPVRRATEMAENDNNAKAQLKELKGLQMAQQKQTKQLLKTQEANLAEYRRQIEKDLEAESKQHSNEIDKLLARLRSEMEAFQKSQATEWKSFRKEQQSRAKTEVKENARVIKAAVKEKEKAFKEALSRVTDKAEKKALKESQEKELAAFVQQSQDEFAAQQQFRQEEEARKRAIAMSHDLHAVEIRHSDSETERRRMAREVNAKHRQSNLDLEGRKLLEQLRERHELMQTQQGKKLLTEAESMQQQQKKREKDLGKQLAQEAKNLPKHVKSVKAKMVRDKQETIRMTKQKFESLQKRIDEDEVSKEERRRLKEEQRLEMLRDVTRTEAEFDKKVRGFGQQLCSLQFANHICRFPRRLRLRRLNLTMLSASFLMLLPLATKKSALSLKRTKWRAVATLSLSTSARWPCLLRATRRRGKSWTRRSRLIPTRSMPRRSRIDRRCSRGTRKRTSACYTKSLPWKSERRLLLDASLLRLCAVMVMFCVSFCMHCFSVFQRH